MIPDVRVTVYDKSAQIVQILDAISNGDFGRGVIKYEDTPSGCGAGQLQLGLRWEEVVARGYYTGMNVVEISTTDNTMTASCLAGATKIYVDSNAGFDPNNGEDGQQAYFWDGSALTMRVPVTGVGSDGGGPYITIGAPLSGGGNPTTLPAYGIGTYVGRRRYAGRIIRRRKPNQRMPLTSIDLTGLVKAFDQADGQTFTVTNTDVGTTIYNVLAQFTSRWPHLTISAGNFPTVGVNYSGSRQNASVTQMLTDIMSAISSGDLWVVRVGHDRTPRLIKLYTSSNNTYTYNRTLPQGVAEFEPQNVTTDDQDVSNLFNSIMVIGDIDPTTKQPVAAIVQDTNSISNYGQIDAQPVTNTALKTVSACTAYATALLNQSSLAVAQNQFKVYVRNDSTPVNKPAGLSNGDVVRGVENITISRFNAQGTTLNACPDSEILYGPDKTPALWGASGTVTTGVGEGQGGSNTLHIAGTGAASSTYAYSDVIDVAPGQWLTISGYVNATNVTTGSPAVVLYDAGISASIGSPALQTAGANGRVSMKVQIPSNATYTQVRVLAHANGCTISNGGILTFSRIQVEPGTNLSTYQANYAAPNIYGLAASVQTTIDAHGDRWQDVKFAAIEPDWNADMAERANALSTALNANRSTQDGTFSYIVSVQAFPPTTSTSSLTVTLPAFYALFAQGSSPVSVPQTNVTLAATKTSWVWLNSNGTYTVNTDPHVVAGAILYGYFSTSATGVIGFTQSAALGATGLPGTIDPGGNILNVEFPNGKLQGDGSLTNVDSAIGNTKFSTVAAGQTVTAVANIAKGSAAATPGAGIIIGNVGFTNSYYQVFWDQNGNLVLYKVVSGTTTQIAFSGTQYLPSDTNKHTIRLSVGIDPNSGQNHIEASIDGFGGGSQAAPLYVTDGSLVLSSAQCQVYTGGSSGKLSGYAFTLSSSQVVNPGGQIHSSTPLNPQGSLLNVSGTPVYSYSSTTTSITIQIPSTTYKYTDNINSVTVPAYNPAPYNGLVASTTYYFNIYYDVASNTYGIHGPSAANTKFDGPTTLADCFRDGRLQIYANYSVTTPASGTGGGSGGGGAPLGGGCPAAWQPIPTRERGYVRADQLEIGMHIPGPGGWVRIEELTRLPAPIWQYTVEADGECESFDVNDTHACKRADVDEWVMVRDMRPGDLIEGAKRALTIADAHFVKDDNYIAMEVKGHLYFLGSTLVHNPITL